MYTRLGVSGVMLFLAIGVGGTSIWAQSIPPSAIFQLVPSKSEYFHIHACYDMFTGLSLNCRVVDRLVGLVPPTTDPTNTGGHIHGGTPPLTDSNAGAQGFECVACPDNEPAPFIVDTFTGNSVAIVRHQIPQFAGRIQVEGFSTPPFGWVCISSCNFAFVEDIAVDGLSELPFPGPDGSYINSRLPNPDTRHPQGSSGTRKALTGTVALAQAYLKKNGTGLRVNDISLPRGGKFDIHSGYNEGDDHISHRRGQDVDIGLTDISGNSLQCATNKDLQQIARALGVIYYRCEGVGGAYHVQFGN